MMDHTSRNLTAGGGGTTDHQQSVNQGIMKMKASSSRTNKCLSWQLPTENGNLEEGKKDNNSTINDKGVVVLQDFQKCSSPCSLNEFLNDASPVSSSDDDAGEDDEKKGKTTNAVALKAKMMKSTKSCKSEPNIRFSTNTKSGNGGMDNLMNCSTNSTSRGSRRGALVRTRRSLNVHKSSKVMGNISPSSSDEDESSTGSFMGDCVMPSRAQFWGDNTGSTFNLSLEPPTLKACKSEKTTSLIDQNVDLLIGLLKKIVFRRQIEDKIKGTKELVVEDSAAPVTAPRSKDILNTGSGSTKDQETTGEETGTTFLDEVQEVIMLPEFDPSIAEEMQVMKDQQLMTEEDVEIDSRIIKQLRDYVLSISSMYRDNPFHNFEHASHVTTSMSKLMENIVNPNNFNNSQSDTKHRRKKNKKKSRRRNNKDYEKDILKSQHDFTYGITSDPLTQFASVFAALIHDVDHTGVPNSQLIKENAHIAHVYKNKSVAEQNSVDLAWEMFISPGFEDLRQCICTTPNEFQRFRQLVVNIVLASDIFDKDLNALRKNRWSKAFEQNKLQEEAEDIAEQKEQEQETEKDEKKTDNKNSENCSYEDSERRTSILDTLAALAFEQGQQQEQHQDQTNTADADAIPAKVIASPETAAQAQEELQLRIESRNRKATIIIEHLIQASDVAHAMQDWEVYRQWNERLFHEMYSAYLSGRTSSDPSPNWYQGEINFFQFYIIPLANKLKDCNVFGNVSDECLKYALRNKKMWETQGQQIVKNMLESDYFKKYCANNDHPALSASQTNSRRRSSKTDRRRSSLSCTTIDTSSSSISLLRRNGTSGPATVSRRSSLGAIPSSKKSLSLLDD